MCKTALFLYTFLVMIFVSAGLQAQQLVPETSSFEGVVVDRASRQPIPRATIKNKTQNWSVLADTTGYFAVEVLPGDTLIFEAMSYANDFLVVPEDFGGRHFAVIEALQKNAVVLEEVTVLSFPSQEQFETALLAIDPGLVAEKTARLNRHLDKVTADKTNMQGYILEYDRNQMLYEFPPNLHNPYPNSFLDPIRWARFIQDWREGRFSEDAVEKLHEFPDPDPLEDAEPGEGGLE